MGSFGLPHLIILAVILLWGLVKGFGSLFSGGSQRGYSEDHESMDKYHPPLRSHQQDIAIIKVNVGPTGRYDEIRRITNTEQNINNAFNDLSRRYPGRRMKAVDTEGRTLDTF